MSNPTIKAQHLIQYQNQTSNLRALIALGADGTGVSSITNNVGYWNQSGTFTSIFTPSAGAIDPRMVASRDYGFFLDGVLADQFKWNINSGRTKWGISAPTSAPVPASTQTTTDAWSASTTYTTMGFLKDPNGNIQQLISVNADGSNPSSKIGTSGKGSPSWNQTSGGTTTDGTITWTNRGPIGLWQPNHFYNEGHFGSGTLANPAILFDPNTNALFFNNQGGGGTSGSVRPSFITTIGSITVDGTVRWEFLGFVAPAATPQIKAWQFSHAYTQWGATNNFTGAAITEPASIQNSYSTTTGQFNNTVYLQSSGNASTSSASFASLTWATTAGGITDDGQLSYLCLGSATWPANTSVQQWVGQGNTFSAIFDTTSSTFQVCTESGTTGNSIPTFSNVYGAQTADNTAIWGCVGGLTSWVASTKWFLPTGGFSAPTSTASYGGAKVLDTNSNIEAVINSGLSGLTQPTWSAVGSTTTDNTITWFAVSPAPGSAGQVTLVKGRQYFLIFNNSISGGMSDLSPVSISTGALTAGQVFLSQLQVSTDPQVDTKTILATADGGNQTTLFLVAIVPNSATTAVDNLSETLLEANTVYQETDNSGIPHGVAFNDPPPNGSFPIKYRGRLYMVLGSFLFFSKNLGDLTTSSGLIAGRYEECWPANFQMDISEGAEIGRGLFTDGVVLYIGTQRHIRKIQGDGPTGPYAFTSPEIVFNEVGILNQDVWQAIFLEGTPAGAMWLTPDYRCIRSDFNTYANVGQQIQTTLNSINPSAQNTSWATFVGIGSYNFYVLAIPTGTSTQPDTLCVYNIKTGRWFIWTPADLLRCGVYYLNLAGIPRWLVNALDGSIYTFDPAMVMDRQTGADKVGITSTIRTTFNDLTDATLRKSLNEIEVATTQSNIAVTVEGASAAATFINPNLIVSAATLSTNIFGDKKLYLIGNPSFDRFYRVTLTDTSNLSSSVNDEILSYYSFEAVPLHRN